MPEKRVERRPQRCTVAPWHTDVTPIPNPHSAPIPAPTREWSRRSREFGLDGRHPEIPLTVDSPLEDRLALAAKTEERHGRDFRGVREGRTRDRRGRHDEERHDHRSRRQRHHALHQPARRRQTVHCRAWCTCTGAAWRSAARPTPDTSSTRIPRCDRRCRRRRGVPQLRRQARPAPVPCGSERLRGGSPMGGRQPCRTRHHPPDRVRRVRRRQSHAHHRA